MKKVEDQEFKTVGELSKLQSFERLSYVKGKKQIIVKCLLYASVYKSLFHLQNNHVKNYFEVNNKTELL